jgi:5'-nucleotidase
MRFILARLRAMDRRNLLPGVAAFTAAFAVALLGLRATAEAPGGEPAAGTVELQLLGVNDFHGHLEPPEPGLGGAAWLGAHLDRAERSHPGRTIRVHAGDMVGASPMISSWFHDEPTVEATNRMGFDVGTLGNHEFDEGGDELLRLLRGGQRTDGPRAYTSDPDWGGARYPYIAANTVTRDGRTLLPPYEIVERAGVRVGFIGVTTEETPRFLLAEHSRPYRFLDISDSVNRWAAELRRLGVEAIVVLAHSGAFEAGSEPAVAAGEIVDETREMDAAVDVVVAGHTHSRLNLEVDGKLVVEAFSYGTAYDRVRISVDRATGDVVRRSATIPRTSHAGVEPDAGLAALVRGYAERVAPLGERIVGRLERDLSRDQLRAVAADAQRAFARADIAFVNSGNLRAPELLAGPVSYAELFEVQAYEHPLIRMRMRGSDVLSVLQQQGSVGLFTSGLGEIDPGAVYTVAANGIIAGGERFTAMRDRAWDKRVVGTDLEALVAWFERL